MKKITLSLIAVLFCQFSFSQERFTEEWYKKGAKDGPGAWESFNYPSGFHNRAFPQTAWTGTEYIIWHGCDNDTEAEDWKGKAVDGKYIPNNGFYFTDGWIINPKTGKFRKMAKSYLPPLVEGYNSLWTGNYLFVWGYINSRCKLYNYQTNTWKKVSTVNAPGIRINVNFLWTGTHIFVYGGDHPRTAVCSGDAFLLDPELNKWTKVPSTSLLGKRDGCITVWTGKEIIVWGGSGEKYHNTGAAYNPSTKQWRRIADNPYGKGWNWESFNTKDGFVLVSTDERKACFYNLKGDYWTVKEFSVEGMNEKSGVYSDNKLIVWTGGGKQGFVWDFASDIVSPIPIHYGTPEEGDMESVWTGDALLVLNADKGYMFYPQKKYIEPKFNVSFGRLTDNRDNKSYATVKANNKEWMAENLKYNSEIGYCLDDDANNCNKYGVLYTWETAKTVCPQGWHLPSEQEWKGLIDYAGGKTFAAQSLLADKSNQTGMSIQLSGCRNEYDRYDEIGSTMFWTSGEKHYFTDRVSGIAVSIYKSGMFTHMAETKIGAYVRCVKD